MAGYIAYNRILPYVRMGTQPMRASSVQPHPSTCIHRFLLCYGIDTLIHAQWPHRAPPYTFRSAPPVCRARPISRKRTVRTGHKALLLCVCDGAATPLARSLLRSVVDTLLHGRRVQRTRGHLQLHAQPCKIRHMYTVGILQGGLAIYSQPSP
jgi:hypothetical protein